MRTGVCFPSRKGREAGAAALQPLMVSVRPATDADGVALGQLFLACDLARPDVDWQQPGIGAWWWVAEGRHGLLGAIQVVPTRPWAYILDVLVHPDARQGDGSPGPSVARTLFMTALATLRHYGIVEVRGFVADDRAQWRNVLSRYATDLGPCRVYGKVI